jgi:hypothetical protein
MVDLAQRRGLTLNAAALSEIGARCWIVARREAVDRLTSIVAGVLKSGGAHTPLDLDGDGRSGLGRQGGRSQRPARLGGDSLTQRPTRRSPPILGIPSLPR